MSQQLQRAEQQAESTGDRRAHQNGYNCATNAPTYMAAEIDQQRKGEPLGKQQSGLGAVEPQPG